MIIRLTDKHFNFLGEMYNEELYFSLMSQPDQQDCTLSGMRVRLCFEPRGRVLYATLVDHQQVYNLPGRLGHLGFQPNPTYYRREGGRWVYAMLPREEVPEALPDRPRRRALQL